MVRVKQVWNYSPDTSFHKRGQMSDHLKLWKTHLTTQEFINFTKHGLFDKAILMLRVCSTRMIQQLNRQKFHITFTDGLRRFPVN
ncbi:hypothetical protein EG68_08042 [Paragonimus skrjabini miyazakii]|uniref:Uncharacterized protein n=1 Tax=Paragonimus skrjabini miyazakii TaxID=59628 RepID=A0A8S9YQM3_9TREM|nr:hypothetical protein EG68_08042 [Paragonimus skrjabini miyazakii]